MDKFHVMKKNVMSEVLYNVSSLDFSFIHIELTSHTSQLKLLKSQNAQNKTYTSNFLKTLEAFLIIKITQNTQLYVCWFTDM